MLCVPALSPQTVLKTGWGGGISTHNSSVTIDGVLFDSGAAGESGGAFHSSSSNVTITNSTCVDTASQVSSHSCRHLGMVTEWPRVVCVFVQLWSCRRCLLPTPHCLNSGCLPLSRVMQWFAGCFFFISRTNATVTDTEFRNNNAATAGESWRHVACKERGPPAWR